MIVDVRVQFGQFDYKFWYVLRKLYRTKKSDSCAHCILIKYINKYTKQQSNHLIDLFIILFQITSLR